MIQTKCKNGHYFDCEEYEYCPICGAVSIDKDNVPEKEKKKAVRIPIFKHKTPSGTIESKQIPSGKVDKTYGVLKLRNNAPENIPAQSESGYDFLSNHSGQQPH